MKRRIRLHLTLAVILIFSIARISCQQDYEKHFGEDLRYRLHLQILHNYDRLKPFFEEAYLLYPSIPHGVLESVSYTYTRFTIPNTDTLEVDDNAIPRTYGPMGLTLHGKNYFRESLRYVALQSDFMIEALINDPRSSILAYASVFADLQEEFGIYDDNLEKYAPIFVAMSELPEESDAMNMQLYAIYHFLSDTSSASFGVPVRQMDFQLIFGDELLKLQSPVLKSSRTSNDIESVSEADYVGAIWRPAPSCNYTSGRTVPITSVTIHYTSGTYAGSIAWFQNCNAKVSAHYVIRSFDGQVTQMVHESDKAWHVGVANGYTIGIEHEAYGDIQSFFTPEMYLSSANLIRDICQRRPNIHPLHIFSIDTLDDGTVMTVGQHPLGGSTACIQIRGHQHYPSQTHTDPGPYWNWNLYYKLVNRDTPMAIATASEGVFIDSGGENLNYGNDERTLFLIHLENADSVVLQFDFFDLEDDHDYMWVYAGNSVFAPCVGRWSTNTPGRVAAAGPDMLVEFRSDCQGTAQGWVARWHGAYPLQTEDTVAPTTTIMWDENAWLTQDTSLSFQDVDDVCVRERFYQIVECVNGGWSADANKGFLFENFEAQLNPNVWSNDGNWEVANGICRSSRANGKAYLNAAVCLGRAESFLFDFTLNWLTGDRCSFYFNADGRVCENFAGNAYQILFDKNDNSLSINRITCGVATTLAKVENVSYSYHQNVMYRVVWNSATRSIWVYKQMELLGQAKDAIQMATGNNLSFVTENALISVDIVCSYASRATEVFLTVGPEDTCLVRTQALNGVARCRVKSLAVDQCGNFSPLVEKLLKVDYTPPTTPEWVQDGMEEDGMALLLRGVIACVRWANSQDDESGVEQYECLLTVTNGGERRCIEKTVRNQSNLCLSIGVGLGEMYVQVAVRARNEAGLCSEWVQSNGRIYQKPQLSRVRHFRIEPNPATSFVNVVPVLEVGDSKKEDVCRCSLHDLSGKVIREFVLSQYGSFSVADLHPGIYLLKICNGQQVIQVDKIVKY